MDGLGAPLDACRAAESHSEGEIHTSASSIIVNPALVFEPVTRASRSGAQCVME